MICIKVKFQKKGGFYVSSITILEYIRQQRSKMLFYIASDVRLKTGSTRRLRLSTIFWQKQHGRLNMSECQERGRGAGSIWNGPLPICLFTFVQEQLSGFSGGRTMSLPISTHMELTFHGASRDEDITRLRQLQHHSLCCKQWMRTRSISVYNMSMWLLKNF